MGYYKKLCSLCSIALNRHLSAVFGQPSRCFICGNCIMRDEGEGRTGFNHKVKLICENCSGVKVGAEND